MPTAPSSQHGSGSAQRPASPARRVDDLVDRRVRAVHGSLTALGRRIDPRFAAAAALTVVVLVAAAVIVANVRTQWFIYDEFDYLAPPEGAGWLGWLIAPHNEHTILFTKLWFSTLYSVIGLKGYVIYAVPMIVCHLAGGVAVYKLMRLVIPSRAIAVAAVAPIALMAAGAGTLTWAGQFQYTAATTAGLWLLFVALTSRLGGRTQWILAIALSLFGTFSGSAFIPLGVAAGFALISLRRYLLGAVVGLIPAVWFVLVRVFWDIPSGNGATGIVQILQEGPEFVFALLNKAVSDTIPVSGSFTSVVMVVSVLGVVAFLAVRTSTIELPRARRTYLFLLVALTLSLVITMIGRLSRNVADSASGGYSYFILIAAIPIFVLSIARFGAKTRIATTLIVLVLLGWAAVGSAALTTTSQGLAGWKSENAKLLTSSAYLAQNGFETASDAAPSPVQAPMITWSDIEDILAEGRIQPAEPSQLTQDEISLQVQWVVEEPETGVAIACAVLPSHETTALTADAPVVLESASSTQVTLEYPTSPASRALDISDTRLELDSVAGRDATLTSGDQAVTVCR
ncbi:hypothetical protein [Herbiconiux liukaitaii]|uniref:hypothetical protein n=1 Tax=Herbiconiux liukaitaii TaxID=3342799 RepID=UPI0035BA5195